MSKKFHNLFPPKKLSKPDSIDKYLQKKELMKYFIIDRTNITIQSLEEAMKSQRYLVSMEKEFMSEKIKKIFALRLQQIWALGVIMFH